jgi:hypothetical protein
MADVQLTCELLAVVLDDGRVHNRRDKLDEFCALFQPFRKPSTSARQRLAESSKTLKAYIKVLDVIFDKPNLQDHGIALHVEHHVYALIAALDTYGITQHKVASSRLRLRDGLTEFFKLVERDLVVVRGGTPPVPKSAHEELVRTYAATFTGGQVNGESKRRTRVEMLAVLLTALAGAPAAKHGFSRLQRAQIWSLFPDKTCARCKRPVDWAEFEAGHVVAKADGGAPELLNGRIEHSNCNRRAGARRAAA